MNEPTSWCLTNNDPCDLESNDIPCDVCLMTKRIAKLEVENDEMRQIIDSYSIDPEGEYASYGELLDRVISYRAVADAAREYVKHCYDCNGTGSQYIRCESGSERVACSACGPLRSAIEKIEMENEYEGKDMKK